MGFLDNSGDIILDAVLTDTGRFRLAKGDGSFKIAKFALGDDEINYELYNRTHSSGSAYYDLEVLRTPVLEAFTNNGSSMKSKLVTFTRNNLLYLPIVKLNEKEDSHKRNSTYNAFLIAVDEATNTSLANAASVLGAGVLNGFSPGDQGKHIMIDQGVENQLPNSTIDSDLRETQYIIEMDNRLGSVTSNSGTPASVSYIDDDQIASYFLTEGTDSSFVTNNPKATEDNASSISNNQVINGPRGPRLVFKIQSSTDLRLSNFYFNELGATVTINSVSYKYVDTNIRITGATTGASIDIPVRFLKK